MFADDCVLFTEGPTWGYIHAPLQSALDTYVRWGKRNYLGLNVSKTKAMLIGTKSRY